MKVLDTYDKDGCDNCGAYTYVFDLVDKNDECRLRLCKKCLLELLRAIIER